MRRQCRDLLCIGSVRSCAAGGDGVEEHERRIEKDATTAVVLCGLPGCLDIFYR